MLSKRENRSGDIHLGYSFAVACVLLCAVSLLYAAPSPLHVEGNKIKNAEGHVVVLRGVSAPEIGMVKEWYGTHDYIDRLTDPNDTNGSYTGWYTKVIRYSVCPNDSHVKDSPLVFNPYNPDDPNNEAVYEALKDAADYGAEKGVYTIINLGYATPIADKVAEANAFWNYMAPRFANDSNVLFELFSEPTDSAGSWGIVKGRMQAWVNIVRTYTSDNICLVTGPCYSQQIGQAATNPVEGDNIVYTMHFYGLTWRTAQSWITDQINAVAPVYPVMVTAWGYEPNSNDPNNPNEWAIGSASDVGEPLLDYLEGLGIGNIAASAAYTWSCEMFDPNWQLLCGDNMGCFVKDKLYEKRNAERMANLTTTKCKVTAGKIQGQDVFEASGTFPSLPLDLASIEQIDVNITSLADDAVIYEEALDINVSRQVTGSKIKYSYKIPRGAAGAITSFTIDADKKTFAIKSKNIDLTGLACPLQLYFSLGYYNMTGDVNEAIVNGKKTSIPTRLMRTYEDTLITTKAIAKNSASALSDSLSVKGDIAVADINDCNLATKEVVITWGDQNDIDVDTFTLPIGSFVAAKKGNIYKCSKVAPNEGSGLVKAAIDFDKATFTISVTGVDLGVTSGGIKFGLSFGSFDETSNYTLP